MVSQFDFIQEKQDGKAITELRNLYLDQLPYAQELYLEMMIPDCSCHIIRAGRRNVGYFIIRNDGFLIEYFLSLDYQTLSARLLKLITDTFSIRFILCKSFDELLFTAAVPHLKSLRQMGVLFRDLLDISPTRSKYPDLMTRPADESDIPIIRNLDDGLFDSREEVAETVQSNSLNIVSHNGHEIGCSLIQRVIPWRPDFDLGMLVYQEYRRKGYGNAIIHLLVSHCRNKGWNPVCGCAAENTASQKTLESAWFVSRCSLLEITL